MTHSGNDTLIILTPGWAASEADINCLPMQQNLVRTLKDTHPDLNIIILAFQYPYFKKTYDWYGIRVTSFGGRNKGGLAKLMLRREINAVLKKINSDSNITGLLSFWYNECAAVGKRFAGKNKLRHYCWILGQDARKENNYPRRLHPSAAELVALSDFLQDEFEKNHGVRPAHMIPPGVDPGQFNSMPAEKDIDIIAAGSLIPLKQYDIFIRVLATIKEQLPGIKAVLIGGGPQKDKLQQLISSSGLQENIVLTGELPHPEVLRYMQRAKLFLHPSSYEGFGVVCIEALGAGCTVISFCKPMKQKIEQWHIVRGQKEMEGKIFQILNNLHESKTVIPFTMDDVVKKMMKLFDY